MYKKCLMRNYDRVTFLNYEKVWGEVDLKNPEFLYLERMECVLQQDRDRQDELRKRIAELWDKVRRAAQTGANGSIDGSFAKEVIKKKEILLNIAYADTEIGTEEWMEMLQSWTEPGEKIRLYHILGESVSFLGGLRDLSVLFAGKGEKQEEWRRLWADRLAAENQALMTTAESIEIAAPCRYVRLYTSYGNRGAELLEQYAGLNIPEKVMQRHSGEYENGKSADVFAMKKEEWIRYIADEAVRRKDNSPVPSDDQARARQGEWLTPTEMLVLQYLEKGYSNSRIGEEMNISLSTVKSHMS